MVLNGVIGIVCGYFVNVDICIQGVEGEISIRLIEWFIGYVNFVYNDGKYICFFDVLILFECMGIIVILMNVLMNCVVIGICLNGMIGNMVFDGYKDIVG